MIAALALSASLNLLTPAGREVAGTYSSAQGLMSCDPEISFGIII